MSAIVVWGDEPRREQRRGQSARPAGRHAVAWSRSALAGKRTLHVFGFTLVYAVCYAVIKAGLAFAPPLRFGGLRALIGGVALLGLVIARRERLLPARRSWPALLALAVISTTITFGAMFLSPGRTGGGIASVLGNTQPLFAVALTALFLGERVTRGRLGALALGLFGVVLIAYPALTGPAAYGVSGPVLALAASAGSALGSVIVKRMAADRSLLATAAWQLIIGSLPLLAISVLVEREARVIWSPAFVSLLLFLALIGTSLATALWYWLVQREDVGRLTLFLFLVPVFGLGIAVLVFGERPGLFESLGVILAVGGVGAVLGESSRGRAGVLTVPWDTAYQLAPSIVLAWSYMVLMACVLDAARSERKIWATIGFGFALMYSVMNSTVYFTELTAVIPRILRGEAPSVAVLLFEPGMFLFAVNGLAYGFMSMAALFASPVFVRSGLEARARSAMLAHGVIGPFIVGAVVWPPLTYIGALWIVTFPAMAISLAILFRRVKAG